MSIEVNFCPRCGSRGIEREIKNKVTCEKCEYSLYYNIKLAASIICFCSNKILLCQRKGVSFPNLWTFPGGYVESGETPWQAAVRETQEETGLRVIPGELIGLYSHIENDTAVAVYEATAYEGLPQALSETACVKWFSLNEIPWEEIAFPSTEKALRDFINRKSEKEIETAFRRTIELYNVRDIEGLKQQYASDNPGLTMLTPQERFEGWEEIESHFRRTFSALPAIYIDINDMKIYRAGSMATVVFTWEVFPHGRGNDGYEGRGTAVLIYENNRWLELVAHDSFASS
jgi:mutator protein MutT